MQWFSQLECQMSLDYQTLDSLQMRARMHLAFGGERKKKRQLSHLFSLSTYTLSDYID